MRVIGLAGWSGSGKTTLVTSVIPVLVGRGLKVATVKHAHHEFDTDQPGKDSWLHRKAGASEVAIVFRAAVGKPLLHPDDDCIVAVATDAPLPQAQVPVLMLDDHAGIANVFEAEALPLDRIGPPRSDG